MAVVMAEVKEVMRQSIVDEILALKVESGKPLRQVKVSDDTYFKAKKFVLNARNRLENGSSYRFKILYKMPSGNSIYDLLKADAGFTSLAGAGAKIAEWRDASKSLVRYALNLLLAPNRPEFQRLKLSSSYYVYQVSKKLKGAEEILQAMGYVKVGGSREAQELKYNGEVDSVKMAETATDLVILDGELQRISDLVTYSKSEHLQIYLSRILEVRSHPDTIYTDAKFVLNPRLSKEDGGQQQHPPQQQHHPRSTQIEQPHSQHNVYRGPARLPQQQISPELESDYMNQETLDQLLRDDSAQSNPHEYAKKSNRRDVHQGPSHLSQQQILPKQLDRGQQHPSPLPPQQQHFPRPTQIEKLHSQHNIHREPTGLPRQQIPPNHHYMNQEVLDQLLRDDGGQSNTHEYANTPKKSNRRDGNYEEINVQPSTLFSPPDTSDFPAPIVQSQSELERMNLVEGNEEISSIVNARSEGASYDDQLLSSFASTLGSPDDAFDLQAEDAWRVDPSSPQNTQPSTAVSNEHKDLMQEHNTDPKTLEYIASQDQTHLGGDTVHDWEPSEQRTVEDNLVTQESLAENSSPGDNTVYDNQDNCGQLKDLKKYDKPVSAMKQKMAPNSEQFPNLPTLDSAPPATDTDDAWRRNMADFENRQPGFKPSVKPRKKIDTEKALTSPLLSDTPSETHSKHHTSPLTSIEQQEHDDSLSSRDSNADSFSTTSRKQSTTLDTMPGNNLASIGCESNGSEDYEDLTIDPNTKRVYISSTFKFDPDDQPLPSSPPDSLQPTPRRRSQAMSQGSPTAPPRSNVAQSKSDVAPSSQNLTSYETSSKMAPDVAFSKNYLGSMLSNVESRSRSNTHSNLDQGTRTSENVSCRPTTVDYLSRPSPTSLNQDAKKVEPPAAVAGTWTCSYCTNLVFDNHDVCDVCGAPNPNGTLV